MKQSRIFLVFVFLTATLFSAEPTQKELKEQYLKLVEVKGIKKGLNNKERLEVFSTIENHPIASPDLAHEYEPFPGEPSKSVGYCFGRAMAVHLEIRKQKVSEDNVKKLFILGDLRSGPDPEWMFHVTTIVRSSVNRKEWFAIDPIMKPFTQGKSQTVQAWIDQVRKVWDKDNKAKLYITSTNAIMPEARDEKNPIFDFVKFDPEKFEPKDNEEGFTKTSFGKDVVWEVKKKTQEQLFANINDTDEKSEFPLLGITLKIPDDKDPETLVDTYFSFKNYFVKLLNSFSSDVKPMTEKTASVAVAEAKPEDKNLKPSLRSMSRNIIQQKKE